MNRKPAARLRRPITLVTLSVKFQENREAGNRVKIEHHDPEIIRGEIQETEIVQIAEVKDLTDEKANGYF